VANETVARRYATAVFSLAKERNAIDAVGRDLHMALSTIESDPVIDRFYRSPVVDRGEKQKLFEKSFAALDDIALHTTLLLIKKRREALLAPIVAAYDLMAQAERGAAPLTIRTATPIAKPDLDAMVARLSKLYGKTFDVTVIVDPALIGGIRIALGDRVIDGTISGRLDGIARLLSTN
jgi:F-type H+-transporting ATPase subunit delta